VRPTALGDSRAASAKYYDLSPNLPDDLGFYVERLPAVPARVLELGCGTGRLTIPLCFRCLSVVGLDRSASMLSVLRLRLSELQAPPGNLRLVCADARSFDLQDRFDLAIAPYRLVQTLIDDDDLSSFLGAMARHLTPGGRGIVTALRPEKDPRNFEAAWTSRTERLAWEVDTPEGLVQCFHADSSADATRMVASWTLRYRRSSGGAVVDEAILPVTFRFFHPEELLRAVEAAGLVVTGTWGGYAGEDYAYGPELIVEFSN
jgi:ubiquinone/menaquinone biosynthesis C-methylase UbiE